jgi:hypothetical protein
MQMRMRNMQKSANMQKIQTFCASGLTGPCKYCFNTELRGMNNLYLLFASLMYLENQKLRLTIARVSFGHGGFCNNKLKEKGEIKTRVCLSFYSVRFYPRWRWLSARDYKMAEHTYLYARAVCSIQDGAA